MAFWPAHRGRSSEAAAAHSLRCGLASDSLRHLGQQQPAFHAVADFIADWVAAVDAG